MSKANENLSEMERRFVMLSLRATGDGEKPILEGDAAVFGVETVVGKWFREKIRPGAFTRVLSESPDVLGVFNHDWNFVLGRTTSGTLTLRQTSTSLRYRIDINPDDPQAMSIWQKVRRGDVSQSSFAFTVRRQEWVDPAQGSNDLPLREIVEVDRLFDVGPVPFAQYPEASAQARSRAEAFLQKRGPVDLRHRRRQLELAEISIMPGRPGYLSVSPQMRANLLQLDIAERYKPSSSRNITASSRMRANRRRLEIAEREVRLGRKTR